MRVSSRVRSSRLKAEECHVHLGYLWARDGMRAQSCDVVASEIPQHQEAYVVVTVYKCLPMCTDSGQSQPSRSQCESIPSSLLTTSADCKITRPFSSSPCLMPKIQSCFTRLGKPRILWHDSSRESPARGEAHPLVGARQISLSWRKHHPSRL
jgi:hypothetical protein